MYYRRRLSEACIWHWNPTCSTWPKAGYFETWIDVACDPGGKLCLECMAIDRVALVLANSSWRQACVPALRPALVASSVSGAGSARARA